MGRPDYSDAVDRLGIMEVLQPFEPQLAGTPPLGLAVATSDIDILCHAADLQLFTSVVWEAFEALPGFRMWQWHGADRPVLATFEADHWRFELFGQARPVSEQIGWRHFVTERRLLALGGQRLAAAVMACREKGMKTEPAFAAVLQLAGDPYAALLDLEHWTDDALSMLIRRAAR